MKKQKDVEKKGKGWTRPGERRRRQHGGGANTEAIISMIHKEALSHSLSFTDCPFTGPNVWFKSVCRCPLRFSTTCYWIYTHKAIFISQHKHFIHLYESTPRSHGMEHKQLRSGVYSNHIPKYFKQKAKLSWTAVILVYVRQTPASPELTPSKWAD